jgi:hypothetical protein
LVLHNHHVRRIALAALLLAAACGDDGGSDDDVTPQPDASNTDDAGASEAGAGEGGVVGDGGNIDGGGGGDPDGGTDLDARTPVPDGGGDAGDPELAAALNREGVRVDMRRADLVIPAFCRTGAGCDLLDVTEQQCLDQLKVEWTASVNGGDTPACLDAQLDFFSCGAQLACDAPDTACDAETTKVAQNCIEEEADGG